MALARWKAGRAAQRSMVAIERGPRRHHLELRAPRNSAPIHGDIGGRKCFAEDPRPLCQRGIEHVEHPLRFTQPAATGFISILVAICIMAGSMQLGARTASKDIWRVAGRQCGASFASGQRSAT